MAGAPPSSEGRLAALRQIPLCAGLREAALAALARASALKRVAQGEHIFLQGDPADTIFFVCSGAVGIVLSSADGQELVINEMRPGDCLGELGVLTRQPRSASAVARSDGQLVAIPSAVFWEVLSAEPELARRMLVLTAQRLQASSEREAILAFMDAEARVARLLLYLERLNAPKGYITISQADLGRWVGLTRQTVAAIQGRWRRRGWLLTGRGRIVLLDYARLGQVSQQF
ncbi:MAG: Crp/Fnr family transcriptional regulator [Chloroflexota bacterium]